MTTLKKKLENFITSENLFTRDHKLLIAVSGGCDSIVLLNLLNSLKYQIQAAHCNFKLRGKNSDDDENFVKELCSKMGIIAYFNEFNTIDYAKVNKYSVEEAARILRYRWFEQIRKENKIDYILTAHHLNDKIETFFINLIAGTGIKGLRSIKIKNDKIIRPLIFAEQKEIKSYAVDNRILFRSDESNEDKKFVRNKIRHDIFPEFLKINPSFTQTMTKNFEILVDLENIYVNYINDKERELIKKSKNHILISIQGLLESNAVNSLLFEILAPYGFNSTQVKSIINSIDNIQTGKYFLSNTHKLTREREYFTLTKIKQDSIKEFIIKENDSIVNSPLKLTIKKVVNIENINIYSDSDYAFIDADKLIFPLILRKRIKGDRFFPFGMKGSKSVSDFITDNKLSSLQKEDLYILTSDGKIVWLVGYRLDNRYKVDDKTKNILIIKRN